MLGENSENTGFIKAIEPVTTVLEEEKILRIRSELPGIAEEKIRIYLDRNSVTIWASDAANQYKKVISLPFDVKFSKKRFSDGVLELVLDKTISD
jgi:HSP20 family molecular chaperone IbpA